MKYNRALRRKAVKKVGFFKRIFAKPALTQPHPAEHKFKTVEKGKSWACRFCDLVVNRDNTRQ